MQSSNLPKSFAVIQKSYVISVFDDRNASTQGCQWGVTVVSKQPKKCYLVSKQLKNWHLVSKQQKKTV